MHHKLISVVLILTSLMMVSCTDQTVDPTPEAVSQSVTEEPTVTPEEDESTEPLETVEVTDPSETEEPMVTAEPSATSATSETEEPLETPEVIDLENPLPNNNGSYYAIPAYATVEEGVNVEELPADHRWIVATVTLGNDSGETVTVDLEDINIVGEDGERYFSSPLIERAAPKLVGAELAEGETIYGFGLFALPEDVMPKLFEWCVNGDCTEPLQAEITLQEN